MEVILKRFKRITKGKVTCINRDDLNLNQIF
nr:MAG TPA: hypothetical protein [Caudoviricetes sp.]